MLGENDHGTKTRGEFPDEATVGSEPFNIAFIAAVEEDGAQTGGAHPVLSIDQVFLPERRELGEAEVIEPLLKVSGLVLVLLLNLGIGFVKEREFAKKTRGVFGRPEAAVGGVIG